MADFFQHQKVEFHNVPMLTAFISNVVADSFSVVPSFGDGLNTKNVLLFRFNQREYSQFRNSLVASYLSYCEYYRYSSSSTYDFDRNGRPRSSVVDPYPGARKN